jgi:hypothetical protein
VGVRENDAVALVNKVLYELGSEEVEAVNAIAGERCSPHPHGFPDSMCSPTGCGGQATPAPQGVNRGHDSRRLVSSQTRWRQVV